MLEIFGIVYGDKETQFSPYINKFTTNLHRFENNAMIDIIENRIEHLNNDDLLGIFSWKFTHKTGIALPRIQAAIKNDADVYNCSPYLGPHIHFMDWSDAGHKGIKKFIIACCQVCGLKYNDDCKNIFYANQFIAKKRIYCNYIKDVIKPSLQLLESDLWEYVNVPAGYTAGIKLDELKKLTGLDFYNYVPFILERMFMQYADNNDFKIVNV